MNYEDHINNELRRSHKQWITKITWTMNYEDHINNELQDHINNELRRSH